MTGNKIGGVNVFGGGLALYAAGNKLVGGLGVSGDTSCADHNIGWRMRNLLGLDHLSGVGGVSGDPLRPDNIVFDITPNPYGGTGISAGGFGHPTCINTAGSSTLPQYSRTLQTYCPGNYQRSASSGAVRHSLAVVAPMESHQSRASAAFQGSLAGGTPIHNRPGSIPWSTLSLGAGSDAA